MKHRLVWSLAIPLLLAAGGCGNLKDAANQQKAMNDLKLLGLNYDSYQSSNNKPPKSLEDLKPFFDNKIPPSMSQFTVPWDAGVQNLYKGDSRATTVFAYGPAVSGKHPVLMADLSTKVMTEEELKQAPKLKAK